MAYIYVHLLNRTPANGELAADSIAAASWVRRINTPACLPYRIEN